MRWYNIDEIVEALEDNYPDLDLEKIRLSKVQECIVKLLEFDDDPNAVTEDRLEEIHDSWMKLREQSY